MLPSIAAHAMLALFFIIHNVFSLFLDNPLKFSTAANIKTTQLLNQLCNESQDDESMNRDACYGCFFRASSHQSGFPLLLSMATCADNYLNNTEYGHCAQYLKNATSSISSSANPGLIYCSFLECVRQVNKDQLIRECVAEAAQFMSNTDGTSIQLSQLFVNTTACVLAKTRCNNPNPVNGDIHQDHWKDGIALNALFVNSDYDINILRLPFGALTADECHKYRNLQVATWPSAKC